MVRIGMLTPSSNTVLEPMSYALIHGVDGISLHFSRFPVTEIALDRAALGQFDDTPMLAAADLLGHAKVDVITWNGTSSAWLGLDSDRRLVSAIEQRTGIRAATCVLTLLDVLRRRGLRRIGLVSPYTDDVQERIVANFSTEGLETVAERHLGIRDNFAFGMVDAATLDRMAGQVASAGSDVIVVLCTNLAGAVRATAWEAQYQIPVFDSVAVCLYGAMLAAGTDPRKLARHGRLFGE